jgi:uncharacterized DUF497 family protein
LALRISDLLWLEDIVEKLDSKHGVSQDEVEQALKNAKGMRFVEKGNRKGEDIYVSLSQTNSGRHLSIVFILKENGSALILSARNMTTAEKKRYEKK